MPHTTAMKPSRTALSRRLPRFILACFCLLCLLCLATVSQARVYLDITSPEPRKVSVAVPYFVEKTKPSETMASGRQMAGLMARGLTFHGFINVINPSLYGGRSDADWAGLGADFAVIGQFDTDFTGVSIELKLIDVHQGQMIFGRRYRGPWAKHDQIVLKFCDDIIEQLTGERGVSLTRIAFISNRSGHKEVYLGDALGTNIIQVTRHGYLTVSPRFSPDGNFLAYTSYHHGNPDLYVTDLRILKTTRPISRRRGLNMAPAWAPDGRSMAVTLSKDGNPDLYLMDNRGEILERLTHGEGVNVSPSWSPDGKKLAFVSDRVGNHPQLFIMDMQTKAVQRLTMSGSENTTPAWSPKGDWIAYTARNGSTHNIFLIKPTGGTPIQLTQFWGDYESPSWSPDGRQLVFSRKRQGRSQLCVMFKNGSGLRVLYEGEPGSQTSPQWSPRMDVQ